jgi:hypothetical protein
MEIVTGARWLYVAIMLRSPAGRMMATYFIGLMIFGAPLLARAAESLPLANDYVLRVWEADDGLPQNIVTDVRRLSLAGDARRAGAL